MNGLRVVAGADRALRLPLPEVAVVWPRGILGVVLDAVYFGESSFGLAWPRPVFTAELDRLLRRMGDAGRGRRLDGGLWSDAWNDEAALLLEEAFVHSGPTEEFNRAGLDSGLLGGTSGPSPGEWLVALRSNVEVLPTAETRTAYWSQRRSGFHEERKTALPETARRFADLVERFEERGYLSQAFGEDCVDGSPDGTLGSRPAEEVHRLLGRDGLWPLAQHWQTYGLDDLCDVIEFTHDHVSRPLRRWYHQFSNCGWHHSRYHAERGRELYRHRVDQLLRESVFPLSLNADGRLEQVAPDELEVLVADARAGDQSDAPHVDELHHAIAQFRARGASTLDRRSAVVMLAGILESRRDAVLRKHLAKRDEGDLFEIANRFAIRHQRADQKTEYDHDLYLEWIFYWYLATVNLTTKILARADDVPSQLRFA